MGYGLRVIACVVLAVVLAMGVSAKKKAKTPELTEEQQEQFLYYFYASRQAIDQEDYAQALLLLDFCHQINPYDGLTKANLGRLYAALGDDKKAETYLSEASQLAPDDCWESYADYLLRKNDYPNTLRAKSVIEQAFKRHPKDADIAESLMQVYLRLRKTKEALAMQDKIDALKGETMNSAVNRFQIYKQMRQFDKADAELEKCLTDYPESMYFLLLRAELYTIYKSQEDIFALCEKMAQLFPLDEQEWSMLRSNRLCRYYIGLIKSAEADSLAHVNEMDRAYETYEIALALIPNHSVIMNNYAYNLAINGGDIKKAERMSAATIKEEPDNPIYLDTYGWILHLQGQNALAKFYLRKALENVQDEENKAVISEHLKEIEQ